MEPGDIFVQRSNTPALVGTARLYEGPAGFAIFPDLLIRVRVNKIILAKILEAFLQSTRARQYFRLAAQGIAGSMPKISQSTIEDIKIPVPPGREQSRIVAAIESYFSRLDDATKTLERVERNLKRYRTSVLKSAVEGRLVPTEAELAKQEGRDYEPASVLLERILAERRRRWTESGKKGKYQEPAPPDTTNLPPLPEGWCWATVEAVGEVLLGRQRAPQYLLGQSPKPYLRVANIKDDRIDFSDVEEMDFDEIHFCKYQLQPNDILVSEGQSPNAVGQSAIYRGEIDGLCFQKTLHRFRPIPPGPSAEFAQVVFRAHVKSGVYMRLASITTNIAHLTLVKFLKSRFPLPPEAEQRRIVEECARLMSQIDAAEVLVRRQLLRSRSLRQSILKWAFEGKIVDQKAFEESATPPRQVKAGRSPNDGGTSEMTVLGSPGPRPTVVLSSSRLPPTGVLHSRGGSA